MKHDINNRLRALESIGYNGLPALSQNFMNLVHKRLKIGPEFLRPLRKFCIAGLLHCQDSHTEVSKQNSTKLCYMLWSESSLQMHVKDLRESLPKMGS